MHRNDFTTLNDLWIRTCPARKTERKRTTPASISAVVRIIKFDYEGGLSQGQQLRTCTYQPFELQLHPLPDDASVKSSAYVHRVFVVGAPRHRVQGQDHEQSPLPPSCPPAFDVFPHETRACSGNAHAHTHTGKSRNVDRTDTHACRKV